MKKFLFLMALISFISPVFAEDDVYLDLNTNEIHKYKTFTPDFQNEKKESDNYSEEKDMILHPFQYIKDESKDLYSTKKLTY